MKLHISHPDLISKHEFELILESQDEDTENRSTVLFWL